MKSCIRAGFSRAPRVQQRFKTLLNDSEKAAVFWDIRIDFPPCAFIMPTAFHF
jgi:hypothetical protein